MLLHEGGSSSSLMQRYDGRRERMEEMREEQKREKKNRKKWLLLLLLLLLLGSCAAWKLFDTGDGLALDPDQSEGTLDGLSDAEIQKLLDDKVAEGQFMLNINTKPVFPDGNSKGTLRIENNPQNRYLMVVKLYLKQDGKDGEKIYESGAIRPGNKIETAALDVVLKKGTYPVTAYFEAYDMKTKEFVGKAASTLSITIKE